MKLTNKNNLITITIETKDTVYLDENAFSNGRFIVPKDKIKEIKYPSEQPFSAPAIVDIKKWELDGTMPKGYHHDMRPFFECDGDVNLEDTKLTYSGADLPKLHIFKTLEGKPIFVDEMFMPLLAMGDVAHNSEKNIIHVIDRTDDDVIAVVMPFKIQDNPDIDVIASIDWNQYASKA